jgi:hypothetical protein
VCHPAGVGGDLTGTALVHANVPPVRASERIKGKWTWGKGLCEGEVDPLPLHPIASSKVFAAVHTVKGGDGGGGRGRGAA